MLNPDKSQGKDDGSSGQTFIWQRIFDLLLLDFVIAFDKISHSRLSVKLAGHVISGKLLAWLNSFLSNQEQRVVLGEFLSEWTKVHTRAFIIYNIHKRPNPNQKQS